MKKLLLAILLLVFFLPPNNAQKLEYRAGYIICHGDTRLYGYFGPIQRRGRDVEVLFLNNFGTHYSFHAALMKGYLYLDNDNSVLMESVMIGRQWYFLELHHVGEQFTLYRTPPEMEANAFRFNNSVSGNREYWLKVRGRYFLNLKRNNYKEKLKRLIRKYDKELASKIGKKGHRFKDIPDIIKQCEDIFASSQKNL